MHVLQLVDLGMDLTRIVYPTTLCNVECDWTSRQDMRLLQPHKYCRKYET